MSDKEFAWALNQVSIVRAWVSALEAAALTRLLEGKKVEGYKLVQGKANRAWTDEVKAQKALADTGASQEDYMPRKLVSPAGAEKIVLKKMRDKEKWGTIAKLIERPLGKLTIAPVDDPRPEATRGSEFGAASED